MITDPTERELLRLSLVESKRELEADRLRLERAIYWTMMAFVMLCAGALIGLIVSIQ